MDRRDFIKLTAITGTSATLASCGNPEHQLIRFVPEEDIVPGVVRIPPTRPVRHRPAGRPSLCLAPRPRGRAGVE